MGLEAGLSASVELKVGEGDTAVALGTGDVPVLATPRVVALCEEATIRAINGHLPENATTVGMRVELDHVQPTRVGSLVTADAILKRVEGRRLTFNVSVSDPRGLVAAGKVTRVVVDRERFLDKAH
jgi:fluoroacetyl-CoA thioesterase